MSTRAVFTGQVNHRFAWIGNDAEGRVDFFAELAAKISAATTNVCLSTMTFNYGTGAGALAADAKVEAIAALLAQKASAGIDVRIVGNGGHRWQAGYFRAQRGGAQVTDNNLPALLHRISFQSSGTAPSGFLIDSGEPFGPRGGGLSYGWDQDVTADVGVKGAPDATFSSPLLRECFARPNSGAPRTWSIELPAGHYYVLVCTGEAAFNSKSFVRGQGQTIFTRKIGGVFQYLEQTDTGASEFSCSSVDGGTDIDTGLPMARRLEVGAASGGRLNIEVGKIGQPSWSSINYLEIYRASDTHPLGDPGQDKGIVQERSLHHTKFVLIDAGTPAANLWTGSHNMTPVDPTAADVRSEDAIVTDEPAICATFKTEFNQWWGGSSGAPNPGASRVGIFKIPTSASGTMPGALSGTTATWQVVFSPSNSGPPSVDLHQTVSDFLGPTGAGTADMLLMMEQLTDGGVYNGPNGTFPSSTALVSQLVNKVSAGTTLRAAIGDSSPTESIFTSFAGVPGAAVASSLKIHDKVALIDTLRDNPTRARGKVLCGSMNWSQSGLHVNDEQTLVLHDPALANQFLQRAATAFEEAGIDLARAADCVIVIDRSYSMNDPVASGSTKMASARVAAKLFLDMLKSDGSQRVALVRFGASVEPFAPPSTLAPLTPSSKTGLHTAIDGTAATLPIGVSTCYGLALQSAFSLLTAPTASSRRMVVFLTDGRENTPPMSNTVFPSMAVAGIEIHTTSFGVFGAAPTGPNAILSAMALASGGTFAEVDNDTIHLQKRFASVARDALGMITILDPTWLLGPTETFTQAFPVDMARGTLAIVLMWGEQKGRPQQVKISTPWGDVSARTSGFASTRGAGYEIWHVDLGSLAARGREVRGMWSISVTSPDVVGAKWRVDLCVFATDSGPGRLVVDLRPGEKGVAEIYLRTFAGHAIAEQVKPLLVHRRPPIVKGGQVRFLKPLALKVAKVSSRGFAGVGLAKIPSPEPGVHEVHVVVEGTAEVQATEKAMKSGISTIKVPFRRECVLSWLVSEQP